MFEIKTQQQPPSKKALVEQKKEQEEPSKTFIHKKITNRRYTRILQFKKTRI